MSILRQYRLRLMRRARLLRARRKRRELEAVANRTKNIRPSDILLFSTVRNERHRLPYFLKYYRGIGVDHFCFVDNGSDDGTREYLAQQADCSIWGTGASYKRAKFGMDWINGLLSRYGVDHWTLTVDADEFFVYPFMDTRPLGALTDWLDASAQRSFSAMLLDMYADGPLQSAHVDEGADPFQTLCYFDSGNYSIRMNRLIGNLWIQGGPRQRVFFSDDPAAAPALNKIPLVKWQKGAVYLSSTHALLPRGLNRVFDEWGGEKPCGCLLHAKFMDVFVDRARDEAARAQHYAGSREYRVYGEVLSGDITLKTPQSTRLEGWRQLEDLGLISTGGWA